MYKFTVRVAFVALVALGITLVDPASARADEDEVLEDKVVPRKVRIKILREVEVKEDGEAKGKGHAPRNPMDTVQRWALKHLAGFMAKVGDGSARTPLHAWFDGGANVPLADLRDALKADGWSADDLNRWFQGHMMHALHAAMGPMAGHGGGGANGAGPQGGRHPRMRSFGRGMGQGRQWGPGVGPPPWMRGRMHGGMQGGRAPMGNRRFGRGAPPQDGTPPWRGFMQGMAPPSSRTIILWNDGSGWHRQEIPGGTQGMDGMHGGMGGGPWGLQPPGAPPRSTPNEEAVAKWRAFLERLPEIRGRGAPDRQQQARQRWFEVLGHLLPEGMNAGSVPMPPPGHPKMRVKVIRSEKTSPGKDVVIEEIIEEEVETRPVR